MRTCDCGSIGRRLRLPRGRPHPPLLYNIHKGVDWLAEAAPHARAEGRGNQGASGGAAVALVDAHHELRVHPASRRWPVAGVRVGNVGIQQVLQMWRDPRPHLTGLRCNAERT